uniref:Uncharacterized protein n=1 Tax=Globodera rostochiensis TaxID=31243 RepID=A0A914I544_GLORO
MCCCCALGGVNWRWWWVKLGKALERSAASAAGVELGHSPADEEEAGKIGFADPADARGPKPITQIHANASTAAARTLGFVGAQCASITERLTLAKVNSSSRWSRGAEEKEAEPNDTLD